MVMVGMMMLILMMLMLTMMMLILMLIDFQVEIDTARGVIDTSIGISRYSIQLL